MYKIKKYQIGKKLAKFRRNGKLVHCVVPNWRWKIVGLTELIGFYDEEEAYKFLNTYITCSHRRNKQ